MRFRKGYELREICGEKVLTPAGLEGIDFTAMLHLSESAAEMYQFFVNREFSLADVVAFFLERYEVSERQATEDVTELLEVLKEKEAVVD